MKAPPIEHRYLPATEAELRAVAEDEAAPRLEGYPALFNTLSEDLLGFRERVLPGAFLETLGDDIWAVWNHNRDIILGRNRAKTLELAEDSKGLRAVIHPPRSPIHDSYIESVRRGDVSQMSFSFRALEDRWIYDDKKSPIRELLRVKLIEVSPAIHVIYSKTKVAARAVAASSELRGIPVDPGLLRDSFAELELRSLISSSVERLVAPPDDAPPSDPGTSVLLRQRELDLEEAELD
jgi:hypothetical protein